MKIALYSDLHLETMRNFPALAAVPQPAGDVDLIILAGDIHQGTKGLQALADRGEEGHIYIAGNHEYYHFDIAEKSGVLNEAIRSNVFLVNNTSVVHKNIKLVFSTLWSHINPIHQWQIERSLNDFHVIKHKGYRFSAEQYNQLHSESLKYIQNEVDTNKEKQIAVFTHHCPTFLNYPEQYKGDLLNEAFAVELHDHIESSNITCWVYGHHHNNTPEFTIGNTKLITNQLGYVQRNEHQLFETDKVIEV